VFVNILKKIKNFQNNNNNNIKKSKIQKKITTIKKIIFLDPQHVISSLNFAR
jgi:hypothetical protein